jgi:protein SCO1
MKTTAISPRALCNILSYKLVWVALLATTTVYAAAEPAPCCPAEPAPKKAACCAALENPESKIENLSARSLYQLDTAFTTDTGQPFSLAELQGHPVVLTMFFASCSYACPLLLTDLQALRAQLPAETRDRTRFVLVSFDVARDTPPALAAFRRQRTLDEQWILLHGADDAVRELAALLGVKYKQEANGSFAHSNLFTVLNPAGEIVHQRQGLSGGLAEATTALTATLK